MDDSSGTPARRDKASGSQRYDFRGADDCELRCGSRLRWEDRNTTGMSAVLAPSFSRHQTWATPYLCPSLGCLDHDRADKSDSIVYHRVFPMPVKKHFQPGNPVPDTGVYSAVHDGHRVTHQVTLRKGEIFPLCTRCADRVRFELVTSGSSIRNRKARKKRAGS
jgi:hypothetical protein